MNKLLVIGGSAVYLALLFGIASFAEARKRKGRGLMKNGWGYALSFAVYCTAWTFYGSVGRAATTGPEFLAIYLGPTLTCTLFFPVLLKIIRISKQQRISSIADFISTRYGKNFSLGVVVTLACVIGVIPYIALQLKAISNSFRMLTATPAPPGLWTDHTLFITLILTLFIILFGTRSADASEKHEGLMVAISFESIVKIIAFLAAGLFVSYRLFGGVGDLFGQAMSRPDLAHLFTFGSTRVYSAWMGMLVVSMLAALLLPRQFQVAVVENEREEHVSRASWMFPLYMFIINLFVVPIAIGGALLLGNGADADMFVLSLPLSAGNSLLGFLVYIGGFSAASGMVIVETIALSTMVSNHLVLPLFFSSRKGRTGEEISLQKTVLRTRRLGIVCILAVAFLYSRYVASYLSLVSIGLVSMAAVAQFAPAFLAGLYWRQASRKGALAGIISGFAIWCYTLVIPSLIDSGLLSSSLLSTGPWGLEWLRPNALFGMEGLDLLTHSLFWSLLVNSILFVAVSIYSRLEVQEVYQAELFINVWSDNSTIERSSVWKGTAYMPDVSALLANFVGRERADNLLRSYAQRHKISLGQHNADPRVVSFVEKVLSGVIGSASARIMVSSVTKEEEISLDEVLNIVRESQQVLELNKELRRKSLELTRATDMLTQANEQLKSMDVLKDEFLYTVTHELRTPLTSIRALAEIVHDNPDMEEEQRQHYLSAIVRETERLSHLITQVLNLERYESGRQKLHLSAVDINLMARQVAEALDSIAREKLATISLQPADSMVILQCDHDLLYQVLYNLVSNAVKFVPDEGGRIDIRVFENNGELELWVSDNGKGIEPELQELIFDKFFQARNQTLKKPQGSGLGLAISRRIIEMHGGRIHVESEAAKGARFIVTLPYQ